MGEVTNDSTFFERFSPHGQSEEGSLWGLKSYPDNHLPLADRVEKAVVNILLENNAIAHSEVQRLVDHDFPGLLTPPNDLIDACLDSYAEPVPDQPDMWRLRAQDALVARRRDLRTVRLLLDRLAGSLGFTCQGEDVLRWNQPDQKPVYLFYPAASAIVSRFVFQPQPLPLARCVLVLPGGRASLLSYKLEHNPQLNRAVKGGWRILKFRHLRQLAERTVMDLPLWDELLDADPPSWDSATQIPML